MPSADSLKWDLARHESLEVVAGCSALMLLPENCRAADRLLPLSRAALDLPSTGDRSVDDMRWGRWLRDSPSLHGGFPLDLPEGLFSHPIAFFGGSYTVFTGGEPEPPFALQLLLDVLALADWPETAREFRRSAVRLAQAVLHVSQSWADAARVQRYSAAEIQAGVTIPSSIEMTALKRAVDIGIDDLTAVIDDDADCLNPVVQDLARMASGAGLAPLEHQPILCADARYVLADPAAVVPALTRALVKLAYEAEENDRLATRLGVLASKRTFELLEFMRWRPGVVSPDSDDPIRSGLFQFDTDKVCHALVVWDDLRDYDFDEDRGGIWHYNSLDSVISERMAEAEARVFLGAPPRPNDMMHLIVVAGLGRSTMLGLRNREDSIGVPTELLTLESLNSLTMLGPDQLDLYKFTRASHQLHEHTQVMPMNPLDMYAMWKSHDRSFYLSDDGRPTFLGIQGDFGREMREEAAFDRDVHAVETPNRTTITVIRLHVAREIPIYAPLWDLEGPPRMAVERPESSPIWIVGTVGAERRDLVFQFVDCIAYWIWQFSPALLSSGSSPLKIEVSVEASDAWNNAPTSSTEIPGGVDVEAVSATEIRVALSADLAPLLYRADNLGERALMSEVIEALRASGAVVRQENEATSKELLDRHAPLGPKKKINLLSGASDPSLRPIRHPTPRDVQDADTAELLDWLGPATTLRLGLQEGPIPSDDRVTVLNTAVALCYERLAALVATLSPSGLLGYLVSHHEALLHRNGVESRTFGARMACFDATRLIDDMRKETPQQAVSATALRFLIELCCAVPPQGIRPMSLGLYDELMALASDIVNRGMASDVVEYGLEDSQLSVLPSGRLGYDRTGTYHLGQQQFLDAFIPARARSLASEYSSHWATPSTDPPDFVQDLDRCSVAEFGLSMSDFVLLHGTLSVAAAERSDGAVTESLTRLSEELSEEMSWDAARVQAGLELLSLTRRVEFLRVASPFRLSDVYPWRFNRRLSYIRRPLIVRGTGDDREVIWGSRHVDAAGCYLLDLVLSERLEAESPEMTALMSQLRQQETSEFNSNVAAIYRQAGCVVKETVRKIGAARIVAAGDDLGDLDVLAADRGRRVLYVVECKDLAGARTPAELSNDLRSTFGVGRAHPSAMEKHLRRISWVEDHVEAALEWMGIQNRDPWHVEGVFVVDVLVLAPFVVQCPLPVISASDLPNVLGMSA